MIEKCAFSLFGQHQYFNSTRMLAMHSSMSLETHTSSFTFFDFAYEVAPYDDGRQTPYNTASNPPAYTRYLIWKELFTLVVTSCMHTEVAFSVQEEFLFPILRFYTSFTRSPALPTCGTQVKLSFFRV